MWLMRPLSEKEIIRIADEFFIGDEIFLKFMRDMLFALRPQQRGIVYTREWITGFVTGMVYARIRSLKINTDAATCDVLVRIVAGTLEALHNTPYMNSN